MAARSTVLLSAALILAASVSRGEGIHGGTAPELRPQMPSERGTMPSFRGEMPSLRSGDQFERWFTPFMPVPTFPNIWLPSRPGFADSGGGAGWYEPAMSGSSASLGRPNMTRGGIGLTPGFSAASEAGASVAEASPPIYLELPDRAGGPRRMPGR
jgi:hypothetical protein